MRQRSKSQPGSVKLLPPTVSWSIRACTQMAAQQHTGVWVKEEHTIKRSLKYREHSPQFPKYISLTLLKLICFYQPPSTAKTGATITEVTLQQLQSNSTTNICHH